jgi:hypothetical protein
LITDNAWQKYTINNSKKSVSGANLETTTVADAPEVAAREIYASPAIERVDEAGAAYSLRWLVKEFKGEYNVFFERIFASKTQEFFAAAFKWKESALQFALEMLLVSNGQMKRAHCLVE